MLEFSVVPHRPTAGFLGPACPGTCRCGEPPPHLSPAAFSYPDSPTPFDDTISCKLDFAAVGGTRHEVVSTRRNFAGSARLFESRDTAVAGDDGGTSLLTSAVLGRFPDSRGIFRRLRKRAVLSDLAHEQLVVVGAGRALLVEQASSGAANRTGGGDVAGQLLDAFQQWFPCGQLVEYRSGIGVPPSKEGQPVRILVVLHPAIGIGDPLAEVRVGYRLDPGDRRRAVRGRFGRLVQR